MKPIRVGIFGCLRGIGIGKNMMLLGAKVVAVCDARESKLQDARAAFGRDVGFYTDFDEFIEHPMDAVVLTNAFHQHAPYAIRALEKNIHVLSECIGNATMAEGVALIRAKESSRAIYMLLENYPHMLFNREIKRVCDGGTLGKILYAEGEYNHPGDPKDVGNRRMFNYFPGHWRNFCPRTYYLTHSLAPLMYATGATPKRVSAFAIFDPLPEDVPSASFVGDKAAIITMQNDDGSVYRIVGCSKFGAHHKSYRISGTRGQVENLRGMQEKIMLRYNAWEIPEGKEEINCYTPEWCDPDEELIKKSGHLGGDYVAVRLFLECIKEKKEPPHPFDVHGSVTMSSVAILSHRSVLEGSIPYDIPDFHTEEARRQYENDRLSPFPKEDGTRDMPCCSHPDYAPTQEQITSYMNLIK